MNIIRPKVAFSFWAVLLIIDLLDSVSLLKGSGLNFGIGLLIGLMVFIGTVLCVIVPLISYVFQSLAVLMNKKRFEKPRKNFYFVLFSPILYFFLSQGINFTVTGPLLYFVNIKTLGEIERTLLTNPVQEIVIHERIVQFEGGRAAISLGGLADNWHGLIFDPTDEVMKYDWDSYAELKKIFGGDLVGCKRLHRHWFHCSFT